MSCKPRTYRRIPRDLARNLLVVLVDGVVHGYPVMLEQELARCYIVTFTAGKLAHQVAGVLVNLECHSSEIALV